MLFVIISKSGNSRHGDKYAYYNCLGRRRQKKIANLKQMDINDKNQSKRELLIKNRPEFEIVNFSERIQSGFKENAKFNIELLMRFDGEKIDSEKYNKIDEFVSYDYTLKNIGIETIEYVDIFSSLPNLFLFNLKEKSNLNIENTIFDSHKYFSYFGKKSTLKIFSKLNYIITKIMF